MFGVLKVFFIMFVLSVNTVFADDYVGVYNPECNANTFNIGYNAGGGTGNAPNTPVSCTYGSECTAPLNTFSRTDYTFVNWECKTQSNNSCLVSNYDEGDDISRATTENNDTITLTAVWAAADATTIRYVSNGGNLRNAIYSCTETSDEIILPTAQDITRANSTFVGWLNKDFGDEDGIATSIPAGRCVSDNDFIEFSALWECNTGYTDNASGVACDAINYNISYELNGGENSANNPTTYTIESSDINFANPTRTNSTFVGWYADANFENEKNQISSGSIDDVTVYAKWSCNDGYHSNEKGDACVGNTITIAYNENGGTAVNDTTCTYGEKTTLVSATTKTGYTFNGWNLANNTVVGALAEIDCNYITLGVYSGTSDAVSAEWGANTYDVTYVCGEGSGTAPSPNKATYGREYTVKANTCTMSGYTFTGWAVSGTDSTVVQPNEKFEWNYTESKTFIAQWSACEPCNAGTGATCELSVVNNQCVYTTRCIEGYYDIVNDGTSAPSCSSCVVSCSGNSDGYTLGDYNVCEEQTASQCYRNCVVDDVSGSTEVTGTKKSSGDSTCEATMCATDHYLSNGVCIGCDSGYNAPNNNTGGESSCVKDCEVTCSGNATGECPANSTCVYDTTAKDSGTQSQGGTCSVSSFNCPVSSFTCNTGYRKNDAGTACERADYDIIYDLGGGTNYIGAPTKYTAGIETVVDGVPTYNGHIFVAWCIDAAKTECNDTVVITEQATGNVKIWAKWSICPSDSVCDGGDTQVSCASLTNGAYPHSDSGSGTISQCYKTCEPYDLVGGTAVPISSKAYYGTDCAYRGESIEGHPCDIVDGTCIITSCGTGYENINGTCTLCNRENALTYKPGQGCAVASCIAGYHPKADGCEPNTIDCVAPNAAIAQREWDAKKGAYGICKIIECDSDYHLVSNACVSDTETCEVPNGVGVREWNHRSNKWGECIATSCNPGYTNDSSLTNEGWKQCGRCNNAFSVNGEVAVSSYVRECEIAACMYQGELYSLENNECRLVCTEYSDETGYRHWDSKSKKCVHECEPGYINW